MTTPDRNEAERFLKALDPSTDRFTFQTFDDNEERKERRKETGEKDPFAKIKHGSLAQHWYTLVKLNEQGAGIFITVNATDFKGRSADNINRIRSVFADLDGALLEPVIAEGALRPHIITETSPGRWHTYWRIVQREVATDEKAIDGKITPEQFSAVQRAIAARYGGDSVVQDLPRVMRLPGFIHRKAEPFQSRVVEINDLEPYDWNELCKTFPPPDDGPTTAQRQPPRKKTRFGALNERALANLDKWVPKLFPTAKRTRKGGYRVTSADLGRGVEEDVSFTPNGIKYFGIADQGDKRKGRRTPVALVAEWQHAELPQAAEWLEKALGSEEPPPAPKPPSQKDPATEAEIEVTRLAQLTAMEYELQRTAAAEKLGFRTTKLDEMVQAERVQLGLSGGGTGDDKQGHALQFIAPEPWPEPVDGAELLSEISVAIRKHVVMADHCRDTTALWTLHTYLIDRFLVTPRLGIRSPTKRCGKTTLLDVLGRLVARPLPTTNVTSAAIFRVVERDQPTLLIDEADTFLYENDELRGVLNGNRKGSRVLRTVGEDYEPRSFSTYSACAIAVIGALPDTLHDRSVVVDLKRRLPSEPIESFRLDRTGHLDVLARKAARWTKDHARAIAAHDPDMPPGIINREADNWRPLLAIADEAGGEWHERARAAVLALHATGGSDDASRLELLLGDIRVIFAEQGAVPAAELFATSAGLEIPSADLVKALVALESRPWAEMGKSREPMTQNRLARMLKPISVAPKNVGPEDARVRGYLLVDFKEAFERYLAPEEASQPPIRPERDEIRTSEISQPHSPESGCAVEKCEKPNNDGLLGGCAVAKGATGKKVRTQVYEVLDAASPGERCTLCGNGGPARIKHGGRVNLWHPGCADRYVAALADPPVKVPVLPPDSLDEHGAARSARPQSRGEPGLGDRTIRGLGDEYTERAYANAQANGGDTRTAELDAWLRQRLADEGVRPEHIEIEFERVMQVVFAV